MSSVSRRQACRGGHRHDAGQDRNGDAARAGAFDEAEVVVGAPEQLGDGEVGARDLLREQRVDVLRDATGTRMPRGERRHRDALGPRPLADRRRARCPGNAELRERLPFLLHAMDELHELGRAAEVADAGVVLAGDQEDRRGGRGSS